MEKKTLMIDFINSMEQEAELLDEFYLYEQQMQKQLQTQNWKKLETSIELLKNLSLQIDDTEQLRNHYYGVLKSQLKVNDDDSFYHVISLYKGQERDLALDAYRHLKMATIRIQGLTVGIEEYLNSINKVFQGFLDSVYPDQKGRLYSQQGHKSSSSTVGPIILNQQL